ANRDTSNVQVASDHEPVAAIVALAATDHYLAVNAQGAKQFRGATSGILHQDEAGDAIFLHGSAVQGTHLVAAQKHGIPSLAANSQSRSSQQALDFLRGNPDKITGNRMLQGTGGHAIIQALLEIAVKEAMDQSGRKGVAGTEAVYNFDLIALGTEHF